MGSLPFPVGASDNVGQFYCQQILPFIQLKNFSNCSGPFTALGNPFVPGSASSPSVLRTCFEFSQFSSHPPFHLYFPHAIVGLPWDILTSQGSVCWVNISSSTKQLTRMPQIPDFILPMIFNFSGMSESPGSFK